MSADTFRAHVSHGDTLRIRYRGATNSRGARLLVGNGDLRVSVPYRYDLDNDDRVADAVREWCDRFGVEVRGTWVVGWVRPSEWVAVSVPGCTVAARAGAY